jgi:hypothetical protein
VSDQTNWVSVEDRLPEDGGYWLVTVATDDGPEVHSLLFASKKQQWIHDGEATFCHGYYFCPTHWAPLPAPASDSAAGDQKPNELTANPDTRAYIASLVAERDELRQALTGLLSLLDAGIESASVSAFLTPIDAARKALSAKEPT